MIADEELIKKSVLKFECSIEYAIRTFNDLDVCIKTMEDVNIQTISVLDKLEALRTAELRLRAGQAPAGDPGEAIPEADPK